MYQIDKSEQDHKKNLFLFPVPFLNPSQALTHSSNKFTIFESLFLSSQTTNPVSSPIIKVSNAVSFCNLWLDGSFEKRVQENGPEGENRAKPQTRL